MKLYQIQYKKLTTYSIGGRWYYKIDDKIYSVIELEKIDKTTQERAKSKPNTWQNTDKIQLTIKEHYNRQVLRRVI